MSTELIPRKTTKKDFKLFVEECLRLQKELNLLDWKLCFEHKDLGTSNANNCYNAEARTATIGLSLSISQEDCGVENLAKHEMAHLLLATLEYLGSCRWCQEDEVDLELERLAVVLERVL